MPPTGKAILFPSIVGRGSRSQDADPCATPVSAGEMRLLAVILLGAFGLRFATFLLFPSVYHPDELFQYLEQGHRMAFGYGVIPWEYRAGMRSWLLPGFLGSLMWATAYLGGGPAAYMAVIGAVLSLFSTVMVWLSWLWARRIAGAAGGIASAIVMATWFELVYFGSKPLTEALAATFLFAAAYLLCARRSHGYGALLAGGLLLGLTFALRLHLAPAILVVYLWACVGAPLRHWIVICLGGTIVVLAAGLLDWATLGLPFQSVWKNFYINIAEGRSDRYGVTPWYGYIGFFVQRWSGAIVPIGLLILLGARRIPIALVVPIVIVLSHSFIGHKELRFLLPAVPFLLLAASVGLVELATGLDRAWPRIGRRAMLSLVIAGWVATSLALSVGAGMRPSWRLNADHLRAFAAIRMRDDVCGVGLTGVNWYDTGGYVTLHRKLPMYFVPDRDNLRRNAGAFNVAVAPKAPGMEAYGFRQMQCFSKRVCLYERAGPCVSVPGQEINDILQAMDQ
jgi:phosphatidylinositol glycan class B